MGAVPIYEYHCEACEKIFEVMQKLAESPKTECESCGGKLEKLISRSSFHLKGGGWYKDLYSSKKPDAGTDAGSSSDASADSGSSSSADSGSSSSADSGSSSSADSGSSSSSSSDSSSSSSSSSDSSSGSTKD